MNNKMSGGGGGCCPLSADSMSGGAVRMRAKSKVFGQKRGLQPPPPPPPPVSAPGISFIALSSSAGLYTYMCIMS